MGAERVGLATDSILAARLDARLLLERGADVNAQDKGHTTPLLLATRRGTYDLARMLLVSWRGAQCEESEGGETPLHLVLEGDFVERRRYSRILHAYSWNAARM
jgi:ankyrin repeat protein